MGGLASGEWWYWSRRWLAINGAEPDVQAGLEWWSRFKQPLEPVLKKLFYGELLDIDVRFGSNDRWPQRKLEVDEDGMPIDLSMQRALNTVKEPQKRLSRPRCLRTVRWRPVIDLE
jgi:hypothetical protein